MVSFAEFHPADFLHIDLPAGDSVVGGRALQDKNSVGDALDLLVVISRRAVVQKQNRAFSTCEKLFELQDLPPVAEGRLSEHPHLGE